MAKKDLFICDFCEASKAVNVDRCGSFDSLHEVPPGWGRLSLEVRADEPTFEKASHAFDIANVSEGTFERCIDIGSPFRMEGIVAEGPTDGWSLVALFVGNRPVLETPTPLVHFKEDFKGIQDAFFVTAVPPGLPIRGFFSWDGRHSGSGPFRAGAAVPQVSVVGQDLLSVGYDEELRATGESVLCGSCCKKLQLRIDEREVPLKANPLGMDPMDSYMHGDGIPGQPFPLGGRPAIRQVPMHGPGIRARRVR